MAAEQQPDTASSSGTSFFAWQKACAKRVTGDEPQGTMGRVQTAVSFPPSFEGTFSSKERRLGTRQNLIHSWYWAWRKHVTSRDSCYPIGCQILNVLSILYRSLQWTDLWITSIVCLCLQEPFCSCTKPQRFKTEAMIITKKAPMSSADILLNNNKLNVAETFKYLGVTVDSRLN